MSVQTTLPPWLPLSYILSHHLVQHKLHKRFLTVNERKYFQDALCSFATWIAFINQQEPTFTELETTAFRVRSMLYEQFIPHLFHTHKPCCKTVDLDQLLDQARQLSLPDQQLITREWQTFVEIHLKKSASPALHNTVEEAKQEASTPAPNNKPIEEPAIVTDNVPLRDIFHTLESDRAAMIEQRKLEEFEAQEELNEAEEEKENAAAKSLSIFNADGNFNLKYLLQGIVANRQKTSLSDRELQNLLSDFKPHRSKWANDDRVGQEELYEACEKVLTDLKNYTEHSTPFLNKVNKREAPDYFEVIKKPMDLGTVTKKMKNLSYRSKKEFADDLYLIYDNCLTYNTNSASEYRKHAIAMRRKTERLMSRVPNISIKERIETEIEEEGDEVSEEEDHEPHRVSKKSSGKHMVSIERKTTPIIHSDRERSATAPLSAIDAAFLTEMDVALTPDRIGTPQHEQYGGKHLKKQDGDENIDLEQEEKKLGAEIDADMGELQDQVWRDKTKKTRAKLTTDVEKQYQFSFGEREALMRSGLDMERFSMIEHLHDRPESVLKLIRCEPDKFLKWTERRLGQTTLYDDFDFDSSDDENLDAFFSRKISKPNKLIDDSAKIDLFLPEYELTSGLPEIDGVNEDIIEPGEPDSTQSFSSFSMDIYPELSFPNYGLNSIIDKSNITLKKVRLMYSKCSAIRNNVPMSTLASSIELDPIPSKEPQPLTLTCDPSKLPPLNLDSESGHQMSQKVLTKLLTHAGFEGAKLGALNVLTDIMTDYIKTIGKTLRTYWDDYGHKMDGDEMLLHTLYENGIMNISELESYVHDDVERGSSRLDDLHRRLQTSYQDLLSGPVQEGEEDDLLNEEETFVTGIFGEDIGEDYFGFKNIGLDQEYNLDSLSIPSRLWYGKNKEKVKIPGDPAKEVHYKYTPPSNFLPVTSEKQIIGLLQPYFLKRLSDPATMLEDEYIPNRNKNRPRYPPTNKTNAGKKKLSKESSGGGSGNGNDHKKSKRKRPTEEIVAEKAERAEKKRQKMEEKALRIAEKEKKRKLREELKEQEKLAKIEAKEKKKAQNKKIKNTHSAASSTKGTSVPPGDSPSGMEDDDD
ncbi:hypothetical protein HPULCUR_006922 [Helicostylum pulchrum]|uniref:Bromo domain-containing protein n=1 Tax=Helicostylum pulchrum TaxID=562976 RepID=A0ABP9Y397_9FUNG